MGPVSPLRETNTDDFKQTAETEIVKYFAFQ